MSSFSSSSSLPPVVPQHCSNVPLLYELLKGEEERSRVWLRNEMNQIPDPLIDSLFHGLIMSSSSSAVPQSRLTVSELCGLLEGEKEETRKVLRGEMDRLVNILFERLTNKLRTNEDWHRYQLEDGGGDGAPLMNQFVGQFESPNTQMHNSASLFCQPSTSTFVLDSHQQHSNGDELELNTVEMIKIKKEVEDGEETRIIDIAGLTEDNQSGAEESRSVETTQQMDCVKQEIKEEFEDYEEEIEIKQEEDETTNDGVKLEIKEEDEENSETQITDIDVEAQGNQGGDDESRAGENATNETTQQMDCYEPEIKGEFDYEQEFEIKQEEEDDTDTTYNEAEIKQEIKEEEDEDYHDDDCDGCDRCLMKREMTSDDDDNSMQLDDSDQVAQSSDAQANIDQVINRENALTGEDEQDLDGDDDAMLNTENATNDGSVVVSNEPSTSARPQSSRTTSKQATGSTPQNATKRKQSQPNCTVKRSRKTVENDGGEDEDGEDIANEDREEANVKVLYLNCTESKCNAKFDSLDDLYNHLRTLHQLLPLQCFASNCNLRFDNSTQIREHIKLHHAHNTQFLCAVCPKEYDSQIKAYKHWHHYHLIGQFECNLVSDCAEVIDTRVKMQTHQKTKHHSQSKHLHCTHVGCTASFAFKQDLKRHELIHLNTQPFHCIWPQCNIRTNRRSHLVRHIRTQHFGLPTTLKEQTTKNIVDERDPNEYVRVVLQQDE